MGTFAGLFLSNNSIIPENKKKEFIERVEMLLQAGGMMEIEYVSLYNKKIPLLRKAKMTEKGMHFHFNYFEESSWESAGFNNKECYVWSGKIGGHYFYETMVAAYVLEELYHDGTAVTMVNGNLVTSWVYVGWINYLFGERYHIKNFDPWKIFEAYYDCNKKRRRDAEEFYFGNTRYAFIGNCEIYAVLNDTKTAIEVYDKEDNAMLETIAMNGMKNMLDALKKYKESCEMDSESQLQTLMNAMRKYYEMKEININSLSFESENIKEIIQSLILSDAPAFFIKAISEIYNKDFWDLWAEVKSLVKRKFTNLYGNDEYYVVPISTQKFFGLSSDNMIFYWKEDSNLEFSEELWKWFYDLKNRYDEIVNMENVMENPLKYIINLMQEVNENYYRIFTFSDFFEETLENLTDIRYQSLWKLYEEMIYDPELKKAGDIIFVPDGPEHENEGLYYLGEQPKRRLIENWEFMDIDKKNNKARQTFRRYMALVANKELRHKIFGF